MIRRLANSAKYIFLYYAPDPNRRGHKAMMLSDIYLYVCLSRIYIEPKSRTVRPRKTKLGRGSPRHT